MPNIPGFPVPIPGTPLYSSPAATPGLPETLPKAEEPLVYTTTGPMPVAGGLAFSKNALVLDTALIEGVLNGGVYGSQGN
jgi:hypothetical protein